MRGVPYLKEEGWFVEYWGLMAEEGEKEGRGG